MKKRIKNTILSLALCASAFCLVGGLSFLRSERAVTEAAAVTTSHYTMDGFTIKEGASIRNSEPNGIRFETTITDDTRDAINNLELIDISFGTIMLPADILGSQDLTHKNTSILDIPVASWQNAEETTWTSVLMGSKNPDGSYNNLPESYYNRPIAARSYVKGTDTSGNTVYYYTANTAVRSIGYVAVMETLDPNGRVTELVETIADRANVELVFNENGQISVNNKGEEGNEIVSNVLPSVSDSVVVLKIGGIEVPLGTADITYSVDNSDVIGVDGSTLTAKGEGEAVISASCTFNGIEYTVDKRVSTTEFVGTSSYKILITEEAKATTVGTTRAAYENLAAKKLQAIWAEATGVELPIVTSVNNGDKFISVGETAQAANTSLNVTKEMASQVIVDENKNVYIRGVGAEAILYGVQEWLGDTVGYEFFMEGTYTVDKDVEIVLTSHTYEPDIAYNMIQGDLRTDGLMDEFAMQEYTRSIIPTGVNKENQRSYGHQGIAHNSVLVLQQAAIEAGVANGVGNITYAGTDGYPYGQKYSDVNDSVNYKDWYATRTMSSSQRYVMMENLYLNNEVDPFAITIATKNEETGVITYTKQATYSYLPAELCYTAHGDDTARDAMIELIGNEFITQLKANPSLTRIGFSHMDHRVWCTCSSCTAGGNPSDNLLEFLLDVSAYVENNWAATERPVADKANFKISSLFYHATNAAPKNATNYASKLSSYGKHVEPWFAETGADYVVPFDSTTGKWNSNVYTHLQGFANIAKTYGMDMLWWGYYGTTTQFYIPYDSLDAIRGNYAIAKTLGIDYMFNQMMSSKQNFARLKEYLMSELEWNADPTNDEWNAWIENYFDGAYGAGSAKMQEYLALWRAWCTTNQSILLTDTTYSATATSVAGGIGRTDALLPKRSNTRYFTQDELQQWLDTIDQAIAALDPNDPNFETYYWNIKLEKATPLYLMMYIYGDNPQRGGNFLTGYTYATGETTTTFQDKSIARKYGAEFLEIIDHWNLNNYGEGDANTRSIANFRTAINTSLSGVTSTTVEEKQDVLAGGSITLNNAALATGSTYTVTATNVNNVSDKTSVTNFSVTTAGTATVSLNLTAGNTYIVEFNSTTTNVKFANVWAVTSYITTADQLRNLGNGYYALANDINCENATFNSSITFSGVFDGNGHTISNLTVGAGGIFGTLNGTVKNVNFADVKLNGGALLAANASGATVENVTARYTSIANSNGLMVSGSTQNSVSYKDVTMNASGLNVPNVFGANESDVVCDNVNVMYDELGIIGSDEKGAEIKTWPLGVNLNYTKVEKKQYSIQGEKDAWLYSNAFVKGQTYTVTVDGIDSIATVYVNGKLSVKVGAMAPGAEKAVVCRENTTNDSYGFDVICATKLIRTASDLASLGVGTLEISNAFGNDVAGYYALAGDLDCAGYLFTPGHNYAQSNFIGTFDGNGYTISNLIAGDSGIFGGLKNATIKNVNFEGVEIELSGNAGWNYGALFANAATNTTFENITAKFARISDIEDHDTSLFHTGLFVANGTHGKVTYRNVTLDVANATTRVENTIPSIFGSNLNVNALVCENVSVCMKVSQQNTGIIYGYSDGSKANAVTAKPAGVTIVNAFSITNPEKEIAGGESLAVTTSRNDVTYTYTLKEAVDGVSISDNVVSVALDAEVGAQFTVVATSNEGYAQELTLTIEKARVILGDVVTFETYNNTTITLPAGISGTVIRVSVDGIELYNSATAYGSINGNVITVGGMPVAQANLGEGKDFVVETDGANYVAKANVYTMIINDATEFDVWQEISAQVAVDQGLVIAAQKGMTYSGYFALGNDIEYNKTFSSYKKYGDLWALCYGNANIWTDETKTVLKDGAFQEDWGKGLLGGFKGVLDGNGYAVIGMQTSGKYNAMFTTMAGGTIKDIAFTNAKIGSGASLINARGVACLENVYIQVTHMENGDTSSNDAITAVLAARGNQNQWVGASNEIVSSNIIVDVSAIDYASLKGVIIGSLVGAHYENLYVVGVAEGVATSGEVGASNDPCLFVELGGNGLDNKDVTARFVDVKTLVKDETYNAKLATWSEPWTVTDADELYFGDYMIYDGLEEIQASAVDANFGHTLAGTTVAIGDTATLDLSEIYSYIQDKTVTVEYNDTVIYEGTIDSASWDMPLAQFTAKDGGVKTLVFTVGTTKIVLPINIVQSVIELNSTNVTSATVLQSILQSNLYGHYVLTSDLDMGGVSLKGIAAFYGILDGQGHVIKNTEIHHDSMTNIDGETVTNNWINGVSVMNPAFIYVNNGTVQNIGFDLNRFTLASGGGRRGIVCTNYGTVENVYLKTKLIDTHAGRTYDSYLLTGLVVRDNAGTVRNVMADVTVAEGVTFIDDTIAAVVLNNTATVENAYAVVTGASNVATVMSNASATCYNYSVWSDVPTANVSAMGEPWSVVGKAIYFGSKTIYNGIEVEIETDETVLISVKDGTFTLPASVEGTVNSVTIDGNEIFLSVSGNVVTFDTAQTTNLGPDKLMSITTAEGEKYNMTAIVATDVITTLDELKALGVGGMRDVTADVTGYYVLGNDITVAHQDDYSDVVAAGYPKNGDYYYKATFDGLGHTIDGIRVADGGIFGLMRNGVVKNVNFKNVYYQDDAPASVTNQSGGYMALLAFSAPSSTFENINVHVAYTADTFSYKRSGVLVCSSSWGAATYRNITVDASGIKLRMLLGISHSDSNVYENVVFKAVDYVAIGYTGDSYSGGAENTAAKMNAFPAGVSFETAYAAVAMDKAYASVYSKYDGNVTDLGFAAGTNVVEANITDAWNHRSHIYLLPDYDYVDIQFALSQSMVLCMWDGIAGNYDITASGGVVSGTSGAAERLIQVFDANGEEISTFEANTMYVLRVYLDDVNGGNRVQKLQISTFAGERTIYYGNITFGNDASVPEGPELPEIREPVYNAPTDVSYNALTAYEGDVTTLGFAADTNVYTHTIASSTWSERIILPLDDSYDFVEFEIVLTAQVTYITAWPAYNKATKGSMILYPRGMTTSDGLVRTIHVFDENGNAIKAQSNETWQANKKYTVRIGFNAGETINELHLAPSTQTFYITDAKSAQYSDLRVYDGTTGALHAYYDGDVTSLGFAAGTKVSVAENSNLLSNRVNVGGDQNYDFIDVQIASSVDLGALTVWTYQTSGSIYSGSYGYYIATMQVTPSADAAHPEKKIQLFDMDGNLATSLVANTAYTLRIYLNGASYVHVGSSTACTFYFGNISLGDSTSIKGTMGISLKDGSFELPDTVSGNVTKVILGNVTIFNSASGVGSVSGNVVTPDATALESLTIGETYVMEIATDEGWYVTDAIVATDVITTTQELRDLGVGGKVYTDRKPTYNNSDSADAGAGGNANSAEAGNDVTGYYLLGNDLDFAGEQAVAAGYTWQQSWFKATFDGNGYTIFNVSVNEGGIFGSMRNATVKNVNFINVTYDMTLGIYAGQYSQQIALLAHVCDSSTIENVNVYVKEYKSGSFTYAALVYNFWNTNYVTNVNIDASGVALSSVLGTDGQSKVTYDNVNVTAASYASIGKLGSTELTEWPTGVTYTADASVNAMSTHNGTALAVYTGDETALGFEEGTAVYESVQDVRTSMWSAGESGFTMEQQALRVYKAADEDYASVQFSLSRDIPSNAVYAFFSWVLFADTSGAAGGYLKNDGTITQSVADSGFNAVAYDAEGNVVTSGFKANTVYTMKLYYPNATAFKLGCCVQDGEAITLYFANPSSGNDA